MTLTNRTGVEELHKRSNCLQLPVMNLPTECYIPMADKTVKTEVVCNRSLGHAPNGINPGIAPSKDVPHTKNHARI
jgi:hypothetical protein